MGRDRAGRKDRRRAGEWPQRHKLFGGDEALCFFFNLRDVDKLFISFKESFTSTRHIKNIFVNIVLTDDDDDDDDANRVGVGAAARAEGRRGPDGAAPGPEVACQKIQYTLQPIWLSECRFRTVNDKNGRGSTTSGIVIHCWQWNGTHRL